MTIFLEEDQKASELDIGMRLAVAGVATSKAARDIPRSAYELEACQHVAQMLRSVARGETCLRSSATSPSEASLSDFRALTDVGPALDRWVSAEAPMSEPLAAFLNAQAEVLERLDKNVQSHASKNLLRFLRFMAQQLDRRVASHDFRRREEHLLRED